jgi:hypothetical protein
MRLRGELELASVGVPPILSAEVVSISLPTYLFGSFIDIIKQVHAASELRQNLSDLSASLLRFQRLAFPATTTPTSPHLLMLMGYRTS